jgi:type IX secretion system PorP/SprF family membrane protein
LIISHKILNKKLYIFLLGIMATGHLLFAQDPNYSQFYAAPMYLNPAFTGSANTPRFTLNYRNQWPSLSSTYITTSFTAEHYSDKYNSGIGMIFTTDNQYADLNTTNVGLQYAYNMQLTEDISLRLGVQGLNVSRGIGSKWDKFVFGDQLNTSGNNTGNPTSDPIAAGGNARINYLDFSSGALVYNANLWGGLAVRHLNRPDYSFIKDKSVKLPMLISLHGGYKFYLPDGIIDMGLGDDLGREKSVTPSFLYERRGPYQHLDLGCYLTYSPMILGAWYRGLPLFGQDKSGATRNVAAVFMLGYKQDNLTIGYSYDANLLSKLNYTGGAHEISISYNLNLDKGNKSYKKKKAKPIPCPKL